MDPWLRYLVSWYIGTQHLRLDRTGEAFGGRFAEVPRAAIGAPIIAIALLAGGLISCMWPF